MKKKIWILFFIMIQCTWGFFQTFLGLCFFIRYISKPHAFYEGCVETKWDRFGGVSLGLFIFVTNENSEIKEEKFPRVTAKLCDEIAVHEYGHAIQSLILGPLYGLVIGIPSCAWGNLPIYARKRNEQNIPYMACFSESWANYLGEKLTGREALKD